MPTYEEYMLLAGKLSQPDYEVAARQALAYLDTITFGRASQVTGFVKEKVNLALYALVDEIHAQSSGGEVASATNDGYTETYVTTGKSAEDKLRTIAVSYLATTGLLYRGGGCGACMR